MDLESGGIEEGMNNLNLMSSLADEELSDEVIQKMQEKKLTL